MDPRHGLQKVSKAAMEYHVNFDGQVERVSPSPSRGSRALVYQGTVRSTGQTIAIKTFRFGLPSDDKSINASIRFLFNRHSLLN